MGQKQLLSLFFFLPNRVWFLEISDTLPEAFSEYKHFDEGLHRNAEIYTKANNDQMWHASMTNKSRAGFIMRYYSR